MKLCISLITFQFTFFTESKVKSKAVLATLLEALQSNSSTITDTFKITIVTQIQYTLTLNRI